jgi:hypothetical protein
VIQAGFVIRKLLEEIAGGEGLYHGSFCTLFVLRMQGIYPQIYQFSLHVPLVRLLLICEVVKNE